ncbi:hypothetical protein Kfla_6433 [Kribbella flavida DSM 17836]|uniref:Uncharacterized protein n=1 Tax=Kribbella flavida (strain DSM 17836 / JCM 10339 / NBRC 14399) TaxID=479435 RepID=D2PX50_KRIFD|nr:hypothetical protein [Kribbella flavida]ADB35430.1 hypothetical protein Kfla_6433 [Kribbella flavida DSM 17836]
MTITTPRSDTRSSTIRLPVAVACLSLLYGVLGLAWLLGMDGYPFGPVPPDGDKLSPLAFFPEQVGAGLVAVLGFLGVPAALGHTQTGWTSSAYRPLLVFTALQLLVFGVLAPSMTVIVITGYLLVLVGLPVAFGFLLVGAWRQRTTRALLLGVLALAAVLELTTGLFDWQAFRELGAGVASIPEKVGTRPLFVFGAFLLGGGWAVLGVRGLRSARGRCVRCGRPGAWWTRPEVARRWGWWATVVAALCPMPYALLRMTWLLPNPVGFDAATLEAEPGIRLFGLGLGLIALAAGIVTLGLIRPWGEIWPRWIPFLAGRPVALKAAIIPAATAATLLLVGSVSMGQLLWSPEVSLLTNLGHLLLFPFPLWGASLALATAAYYYRRRTACAVCG